MDSDRIFHLTARSDWEEARAAGSYPWSTRGRRVDEEGFVHCSRADQVVGVAGRYFTDVDDLVLLELDTSRVDAEIRDEEAEPGGERFPHIYGPLPLDAVVAVHGLERRSDGEVELPAAVRDR